MAGISGEVWGLVLADVGERYILLQRNEAVEK
jgi:hypothetical protein